MSKSSKLFAAVAVIALAGVAAVGLRTSRVDLIVDNGLEVPVRITLAGDEVADVPARSSHRIEGVPAGQLELAAVELAGEGRRFTRSGTIEAAGASAYVWNVAGATSKYWIVAQGYGDQEKREPDPQEFATTGDLFPIPPGLQPTLDELHPTELRVAKGQTGALLKALFSEHWCADYQGSKRAADEDQAWLHQLAEQAKKDEEAKRNSNKKTVGGAPLPPEPGVAEPR